MGLSHLLVIAVFAIGLFVLPINTKAQEVADHPPNPAKDESTSLKAAWLESRNELVEISDETGCGPSSDYAKYATKLAARGFSPDDYISACRAIEDFSLKTPRRIEDVAVLQALEFNPKRVKRFLGHGLSLKEFMFSRYYKAKGTGSVLLAIGTPVFAGGLVLFLAKRFDDEPRSETYDFHGFERSRLTRSGKGEILGAIVMIAGGVVTIAGVTVAGAGAGALEKKLPPEGLLENGKKEEIKQWHEQLTKNKQSSAHEGAAISDLVVAPVVDQKPGGLSLGFRF